MSNAHLRLVARLREQADDVRRLASGLAEDLAAKRVIPEKWSLKELVCHLWRVQQVFEGRVGAMLSESNPAIVRYDPEGDREFDALTARPAEESLSRFMVERARFAERLERLSREEWHRRGTHPEFPHFDVHFQVEYMLHHEAHHIYQMYQRRSALGKIPHG